MAKKNDKHREPIVEASQHDQSQMLKDCRQLLTRIEKITKKYDSYFLDCKRSLKAQEVYLDENNKLHQMVDESLGNVLLAIRQNEYLQAWYPEQHGFQAMKVVGKHPAKK